MKLKRYALPGLLILAVFMVWPGCTVLKQPAVDKHFFALQTSRPAPNRPAPDLGPVLRVAPFKVSALYQDPSLVYRDRNLEFQSDFYNQFLVPPGQIVSDQTSNWLANSGLFQLVLSSPGKVMPDYLLEGTLSALYGDFRNPQNPKAVMDLQLFLVDAQKPRASVVIQRSYHKEIPLSESSAQGLVQGWNAALSQILVEFEQILATTDLNATQQINPPPPGAMPRALPKTGATSDPPRSHLARFRPPV